MNLTDAERTELAGILRTVAAWQLPPHAEAIPALATWADRLEPVVATDHADDDVIEVEFDPDVVVAWDGSNPIRARGLFARIKQSKHATQVAREQAVRYRKQRDNAIERGDRLRDERNALLDEIERLRPRFDATDGGAS